MVWATCAPVTSAAGATGGASAGVEQINRMVAESIMAGERFYPAFQLVCWGGRTPRNAMQVAMAEAYGRA